MENTFLIGAESETSQFVVSCEPDSLTAFKDQLLTDTELTSKDIDNVLVGAREFQRTQFFIGSRNASLFFTSSVEGTCLLTYSGNPLDYDKYLNEVYITLASSTCK